MGNTVGQKETGRYSEASLYSVIFAPSYHNSTLTALATQSRVGVLGGAQALPEDEFVARRMVENAQLVSPEMQDLVAQLLLEYLESRYTTTTVTLPSGDELAELDQLPPERFSFTGHLDLLSSAADEGEIFDSDNAEL